MMIEIQHAVVFLLTMWYTFFVPEDNLQSNDNNNNIITWFSWKVERTCFVVFVLNWQANKCNNDGTIHPQIMYTAPYWYFVEMWFGCYGCYLHPSGLLQWHCGNLRWILQQLLALRKQNKAKKRTKYGLTFIELTVLGVRQSPRGIVRCCYNAVSFLEYSHKRFA